jgi:hypothetical protein
VIDAGLALLVLLATTTLSVYKPWGITPYGRRRQHQVSQHGDPGGGLDRESAIRIPLAYALVVGALLLVVLLHLTGVVGRH